MNYYTVVITLVSNFNPYLFLLVNFNEKAGTCFDQRYMIRSSRMETLQYLLAYIGLSLALLLAAEDYWDPSEIRINCSSVTEIYRKTQDQCNLIAMKTNYDTALFKCKTLLSSVLEKKCSLSAIESRGELHTCHARGSVKCCFTNATCINWSQIQSSILKNSMEYLVRKKKVLDQFVNDLGYKTCHHLDSLDATKCAEDCESLEKGEFAKNCTSNGGLFKCCIRRDHRSCDKCRFCCTLPMCTIRPGGRQHTVFDYSGNEIKMQKNKKGAVDIFFSDESIYKKEG